MPARRRSASYRSSGSPGTSSSENPSAWRRLHAVDQRVDAGAVVVLGDEQIGLHRQEEVADILCPVERLVLVADLAAEIGAGDHAGEDVHEHRDARALVATD